MSKKIQKQKKVDWGDWIEKYKPLNNEGNLLDADPRMGNITQKEFEKAGKERRLWTMMDDNDGGECYIVNRFAFVNRLEHYITEVPYKEGEDIIVE